MAPLDGIRVVDASIYLSGPFGAMILADLGAEVIRVEPPRGDPYRRFGEQRGDSGLLFKAVNQNKTAVSLDLKSEEGIAGLHELLADADVLITNWRPHVAPSMGLTPESVKEKFPRLVWARVSGYGQDGPRSGLPAFDMIIQARSGYMVSGRDEPMPNNHNMADKVSAMFNAHAVMAALVQRDRTGEGSVCDMAMVDAMAYFYGADISAGHRMVGAEPDMSVSAGAGNSPVFSTAEGYVVLSPVSGRQVRRAMEAVGCGDKFGDVMSAPKTEVFAVFAGAIAPTLLTNTAAHWEEVMIEADVPAAAVRTFVEHLADEQTLHNQTYRPVDDPSVDGEFLQVRFPSLFDGEPAAPARSAAPPLAAE